MSLIGLESVPTPSTCSSARTIASARSRESRRRVYARGVLRDACLHVALRTSSTSRAGRDRYQPQAIGGKIASKTALALACRRRGRPWWQAQMLGHVAGSAWPTCRAASANDFASLTIRWDGWLGFQPEWPFAPAPATHRRPSPSLPSSSWSNTTRTAARNSGAVMASSAVSTSARPPNPTRARSSARLHSFPRAPSSSRANCTSALGIS